MDLATLTPDQIVTVLTAVVGVIGALAGLARALRGEPQPVVHTSAHEAEPAA